MRVRILAVPLVLVGLVAAPTYRAAAAPDPAVLAAGVLVAGTPQTDTSVVIDGRLNPELIPPEVAWEHFFYLTLSFALTESKDAEPNPRMVTALSKYSLLIPPDQVKIVLVVAKATVTKVDQLRQSLESGEPGAPRLTVAQRESILNEITTTVLSGRDTLRNQLSKDDMAAVDRYVTETIIPAVRIHKNRT